MLKDLKPALLLLLVMTVLTGVAYPLIVTGTVLFTNRSTSGFVQRDQETFDSLGRRRVIPTRMYMERKGFILRPKFVFIDGRTGATMYSESYREEMRDPAGEAIYDRAQQRAIADASVAVAGATGE